MGTSNMGHHIRFDEQFIFETKIPEQRKPKGALAQLPEMPDNPFFKREAMKDGHVYQAKQHCWYWLTTIIGPMERGDYLPTAVHGEQAVQNLADEPQIKHAWQGPDSDKWQQGGIHLHHWHGGEIAEGMCIYIGGAVWNPDYIQIPGGDIILSAGGGATSSQP